MMTSVRRRNLTFAISIIGKLTQLATIIGFIYLTIPSRAGLALGILVGIAATYMSSIFLYNLFILQNKEKQLIPKLKHLSKSDIRKREIKAGIFLAVTIPSVLLVIGANILGAYQECILLGHALLYPDATILIASIVFSAILGVASLLAICDQIEKIYSSIKGVNNGACLPIPQESPLRCHYSPSAHQIALKNTNEYKKTSISELRRNAFFKAHPEFQMPDSPQGRIVSLDNQVTGEAMRRYSFS